MRLALFGGHILNGEFRANIRIRHLRESDGLIFDFSGARRIVAVGELDQETTGITNRAVVPRHQILHRLHELTLHVTGIGRLNRCINETLTTRHRVEEELRR